MKETFREFYNTPSKNIKSIWRNKNTIYIFDTNIFLNLYSLEETTLDDFFSILEKIKDRIWIPFHVGLEYQKRRKHIIIDEINKYKDIKESIDSIKNGQINQFNTLNNFKLKTHLPTIFKKIEKWKQQIRESSEEICAKINKEIDELNNSYNKKFEIRNKDIIRDKLDTYFSKKIGINFTEQKELDEIYKDGEERYKNKAPPGYKDTTKGEDFFIHDGLIFKRKFGDLIIFKQIIEYAKNIEANNIIFITDDKKEDWWELLVLHGEKQIGPRHELKNEIYKNCPKLKELIFYSMESFLNESKQQLDVDIQENSLNDIRNLPKNKEIDISAEWFYLFDFYKSELMNIELRIEEIEQLRTHRKKTYNNLDNIENSLIQIKNEILTHKDHYSVMTKLLNISDQLSFRVKKLKQRISYGMENPELANINSKLQNILYTQRNKLFEIRDSYTSQDFEAQRFLNNKITLISDMIHMNAKDFLPQLIQVQEETIAFLRTKLKRQEIKNYSLIQLVDELETMHFELLNYKNRLYF